MAKQDLGAVANRLFEGFLAPLVLGGELLPGRPIGARAALALGDTRVVADSELLSRVQLARTRVARRLVAIDRLEAPTIAEWALGAASHDLVQSAHPRLAGTFRRSAPERLLGLVSATLERIPAPASVGESVSRHTWFSRILDVERTDTVVRWWVGSRTFLGTAPPPRLMAWPELRRVNVERTPHPLVHLPSFGGAVDSDRFDGTLAAFLAKTPLTDLASCHRAVPAFHWSSETLGLVTTRAGRTLALRAMAQLPSNAVDAAMGRAARKLLVAEEWRAAGVALELLGERAIAEAEVVDPKVEKPLPAGDDRDEAAFARAVGAVAARQTIATRGDAFPEAERRRLLALLEPRAASPAARHLESLLGAAPAPAR